MASPDFSAELEKVRRLAHSQLKHQAKPATLLQAIEHALTATLGTPQPHTPTAYFASLLQCLQKASNDEVGEDEDMAESENMGQGALIPATLYLLAIVVPETPNQVVLSSLSPVLECILPLYDGALEHPPALRSLLQITTSLILISPVQLLMSLPLLKKAWNYLLELNLDPRPKVRHQAQEGVRKVLVTPIPPRQTPGNHPYLPRAREWVMGVLEEEVKSGGGKGKKARFADAQEGDGKRGIQLVQGLRNWVAVWGEDHLSSLCAALLALPPLPHLTSQVYSLLAFLLTPPPSSSSASAPAPAPAVLSNLPTILDSLLASPPASSELPTYLSAITSALIKTSLQEPALLPTYLPKAHQLFFKDILLAPNAPPAVLAAAAASLGAEGMLRYCITDEMILATLTYMRQGSHVPGARKKSKTPFLFKFYESLVEAMNTNALRLPYFLTILTALISRLRLRVVPGSIPAIADPSGTGPAAAQELVMDLLKEVGDLRTERGFENKDKVDEVVGVAMDVIGVEAVLKVLPLNIEPDASGVPPQPGRAHLLPLIRHHTTNDSLSFFSTFFRPLSERLFNRKVAASDARREGEAKVWEVVVSQIWDCFPGFCEMPRDMGEGLDTQFLGLVTGLLYTQPTLLPALLKGLTNLVTSTERLIGSTTAPEELRKEFGLDQTIAQSNLTLLKSLAKDMISVLLNVFSKMPRESRGQVGDVISTWVGIMTPEDVVETYQTVTTHLSNNLDDSSVPAEGASPVAHTMLDLLIIFTPILPLAQSLALFTAVSQPTMLQHRDATVQKKSYRLLKRLLEGGKLSLSLTREKLEAFVGKLGESGSSVGPGAQRDRLQLLSALVTALPKDALHIIPEILSEAVLGTKEVNEKARDAGFELLVLMGHKMAEGGVLERGQQQVGDDEDMGVAGTVDANAEEYLTMVAAGLTGTTPHTISASINALSRLLFEFRSSISAETTSELLSTLCVFLASKNREIVKSALGFAKVSIVSLPVDALRPHLGQMVPALLGWVHDHKNHFKSKTIHIFERLLRRFGFDEVYAAAGATRVEEKKVLMGIKKRKDRAKRKRAGKDEGEEEEGEKPKATSGNAFDDILYNSDSDIDSEDDEEKDAGRPQKGKKGKKADGDLYIRNDEDEPMDLLSRSIAGASNPAKESRRRKPGEDASKFQTDKSGKLIIPADGPDDDERPSASASASADATAYLPNNTADGTHRDTRGNLKFNRNTKRAREEEKQMFEVFDEEDRIKAKVKERKKMRKTLGDEFKAKRAGGDIKRNDGPDPYSYVSLGQASGKKGGKASVNLTNKKKGSRR
ncbi:ribosomal RNA-processing protein 12 [Cryptococcus wingfieldii CBS 7118]|uniref:Ribosomal RNA-processing protein 12 n=1 Tax=Cryptococcus wingfieldii CBS 7118 TaxID=1295528 RepID=A0A1E3HJ05_9TREE|nr:ribosomal RNA-processing protein 12 [Cryptococcus wingfieldii CBS 7118]ODN76332.1 ribosomal RNA-processing protein 12 [Cryptococcus wingfieldii CBS 7118]